MCKPNLESLTIVIPLYGESPYVLEALNSCLPLMENGAEILLIDDGLTLQAKEKISRWKQKNLLKYIKVIINPENLGLFQSLNLNIQHVNTNWFCFLCSDDFFQPDAVDILQLLIAQNNVGLILSRFQSVNEDASIRYDECRDLLKLSNQHSTTLSSAEMLIALLKYGSLNGNLSGLIIHKNLWNSVGGFSSLWSHAADWEWIMRAVEQTLTFVNLRKLVAVRTHKRQLSNMNLDSGSTLFEAAIVVRQLRDHPLQADGFMPLWWAAQIMQHHLWNLIFRSLKKSATSDFIDRLNYINKAVPLWLVLIAMVCSIPKRLYIRLSF